MKEALKEEIGVCKENLKAVIYLFVLDLTATVTRAVKVDVFDVWVLGGILGLLAISLVYILNLEKDFKIIKAIERGRKWLKFFLFYS
ncbi:hypothetical protein SAMN06269117_11556 [Balnearium lithotrophicum]|uniref:Uncharacterized protein n=1 Tax=Balnearium lithotrophicum TaxID=223788 RepID=A0A521CW10_9BACT|nr:hypothetical protein [Balnearium lithotrophicum]SMO63624.1 hypothetical protein SAMN06269117_11556 [Balnearium lithotrophicum]